MKFRVVFLLAVLLAMSSGAGWHVWAARQAVAPSTWQAQLQHHLLERYADDIRRLEGRYGFHPEPGSYQPDVVLIHGLDEPGGIWDELQPALANRGLDVWPFRYPNDQAIARSADFLAEQWAQLPSDRPVVLVGHSMGGLVIRDFVTRYHPVSPVILGVILVGTPNHGSEWARFRVWLEVREQLSNLQRREFSVLAALQEGTGEAKLDLQPQSAFLQSLNGRPWPTDIPIQQIGGVIAEPTRDMSAGLNALHMELGPEAEEMTQAVRLWWKNLGQALGDGVVPVDSVKLPPTVAAPEPLWLTASHRGLLVSRDPRQPAPAIEPILTWIDIWRHQRAQTDSTR